MRQLHALLREGGVEKHYAALVAGRWRLGNKTIDAPVLTNTRQGGERVVRVHAAGKTAISRFTPRANFRALATLMDVAIDTGRTHQIRVHAAFAGHPVAGDDKYGDRDVNRRLQELGLRRMFLHAAELSFRWPDTGLAFRIAAPLPPDLAHLLRPAGGRGRRSGLTAASGSSPARRSALATQINGRPMSAVGSLDSIASKSATPRPSARNPPAQSKGRSSWMYASIAGKSSSRNRTVVRSTWAIVIDAAACRSTTAV